MEEVRWDLVRVLVVDDDPVFARLMQEYVKKLGCPAVFCENGRAAVEQFKAYNFDVCFMDVLMPEMNGIEAAQVIREDLHSQVPIIALTSLNMKVTQEKCTDVGMNDFIVKPISFEVFKEMVGRYGTRRI
jgi:two-component system, sensor histidine kinase